MPLQRQVVTPAIELVKALTTSKVLNSVPTGFRWFHEDSLAPTKELGQLLHGMADVLSPLVHTSEELKYAAALRSATGVLLDLLGQGYGILRNPLEIDDDYAIRIQQELLIERVTGPAILAGLTALMPGAVLFEPWRFLPKPSENWIPSDDQPLESADYWRTAVFDLFLYPDRGDVPGIESFIQFMKAYGVKHWFTVVQPDAHIDTNDDPLIPDATYLLLPNGLQDPRTPRKANNVVVSNTILQTDDVAGPWEGWLPSAYGGEPSGDLTPSGFEETYFVLDLIQDFYTEMGKNLLAGDPIPTVGFDRQSANYAAALLAGFSFPDIPVDDLSKNVVISVDIFASEAIGSNVYNIIREPFTPDTTLSDIQAKCVIRQMTSLGDPDTLGSGTFLGGELVSS